jgi:hypothetical protein
MRFLNQLRYRGEVGFLLALIFSKLREFLCFRLLSDTYYIKKQFKKTFGYELDLENPITLNEKMQWLKLHDRNPLNTLCADKLAVREYVAQKAGKEVLIPLLFHTSDYREIKPENLPDIPFIIKATHTAGTNHIVWDKNKADWRRIRKDCRWWLHKNYYYPEKEWQYKNIKPQIVVEKLLTNAQGEIPSDYKLHYFNGRFGCLQVDIDRFTNHKRNFYDEDWRLLPFTWSIHENGKPVWDNGRPIEKPEKLREMISLGEKLAAPFRYARIDLYLHDQKIFFGEITFHHGGGFEHFEPFDWDKSFGEKVSIK